MNESNARIETGRLLGFSLEYPWGETLESLEYPWGETLELAPWQVLAGTTHQWLARSATRPGLLTAAGVVGL